MTEMNKWNKRNQRKNEIMKYKYKYEITKYNLIFFDVIFKDIFKRTF